MQEQVADRWNSIRQAIRQRWAQITEEDLRAIDGDSRKLVALVNQKTDMPLHEIEAAIDEIAQQSGGLLSRVLSSASDFAADASRRVAEPAQEAWRQARTVVAERPMASLGGAFGAGLVVGLCCGLLLFERPQPPRWWEMHR
jgi:ElaB/YqjD/DUF883 family membrane-anchored ribosome-binding protein